METISSDLILNDNSLKYYNFYNLDQDLSTYFTVDYYKSNLKDTIENYKQELNVLFIDIEVFIDNRINRPWSFVKTPFFPVSAITFYSTYEKKFHVYFLKLDVIEKTVNEWNVSDITTEFKTFLINESYIKSNEELEIVIYDNEIKMLSDFWYKVKELEPHYLSGWNSHHFDYPYIYNRMIELFNNNTDKVNSIISFFDNVEYYREKIVIPEYVIADLMFLYIPRQKRSSMSGLAYGGGKIKESFKLDFIAQEEVKLTKLEYKAKYKNLVDLYKYEPKDYLKYNIGDTALVVRLNEKLKFVELFNTVKRLMRTNPNRYLNGNSALFESYYMYKLLNQNKFIRFGIVNEREKELSEEQIKHIPIQQFPKINYTPTIIDKTNYRLITNYYKGAFVLNSNPFIINTGTVIDFDFKSLYPNMLKQNMISFDGYYGKIINPVAYDFINNLDKNLSTVNLVLKTWMKLIDNAVEDERIKLKDDKNIGKTEAKRRLYTVMSYLLITLAKEKDKIKKLFKPTNMVEQILLNYYLIPLINIRVKLDGNCNFYNEFCLDKMFYSKDELKKIYKNGLYIITNMNKPCKTIELVDVDFIEKLLSNHILTINGCFFENKKGLTSDIIDELLNLRDSYKKKRKSAENKKESKISELKNKYNLSFENLDSEYATKLRNDNIGIDLFDEMDSYDIDIFMWDLYQLALKIISNSHYGVLGQKQFIHNIEGIAEAVTSSGKLALIISQNIVEKYIEANY